MQSRGTCTYSAYRAYIQKYMYIPCIYIQRYIPYIYIQRYIPCIYNYTYIYM